MAQGVKPKELENLVEMPEMFHHCWYWFIDLNNTRPSSFGFSAIPYCEIQAYFSIMQIDIQPWEVEVIKIFDRVAMEVVAEQQAREEQQKKNRSK